MAGFGGPTGGLRWLKRDGEMVLQQHWQTRLFDENGHPNGIRFEWVDVPIEEEGFPTLHVFDSDVEWAEGTIRIQTRTKEE